MNALLLLIFVGCAPIEGEDEPQGTVQEIAEASASELTLTQGTATPIAENIAAAENLFITSDERLIVSGDKGIYEIRNVAGEYETVELEPASDCQFAGITESQGFLYVNCYNFSISYLYASELSDTLSFRRVFTLKNVLLANGLTADGEGNLYVASTVLGQILKLSVAPDDGFNILERNTFLNGSGLFTNGLKFYDGALYWTDGGNVNRAPIANGRAGRKKTVARAISVLDDLFVDEDNMLVADYLGNGVRAFDHSGRQRATNKMKLTSPSAVLATHGRAGFPDGSLLVTEKGANRVTLITR